jgi:hypothetical protein
VPVCGLSPRTLMTTSVARWLTIRRGAIPTITQVHAHARTSHGRGYATLEVAPGFVANAMGVRARLCTRLAGPAVHAHPGRRI